MNPEGNDASLFTRPMHHPEAGVICAYTFDGKGGGKPMTLAEVKAFPSGTAIQWVHLDRENEQAREWVRARFPNRNDLVTALVHARARPRARVEGDALLLILRGVNLNPGDDPRDLISVRFYLRENQIISLRHRRSLAINDVREQLERGDGPLDVEDFLTRIVQNLNRRMEPLVDELVDDLSVLEEEVITADLHSLRSRLSTLRRHVISMRRWLLPQREAISRLLNAPPCWLKDQDLLPLREVQSHLDYQLEELEATREASGVTHDELAMRASDSLNGRMYTIAVLSAIFLPLTFVTGLLGINVAGIPGAEHPHAFAIVCGVLALVGVLQLVLMRRGKWL